MHHFTDKPWQEVNVAFKTCGIQGQPGQQVVTQQTVQRSYSAQGLPQGGSTEVQPGIQQSEKYTNQSVQYGTQPGMKSKNLNLC